MAVKEILDKRVIGPGITMKTKDEIICRLTGFLMETGCIQDLEGHVKDVYLRKSGGITGIGDHMATPHGKSDYVDHAGLAVGRTRDMVEWEPYDERPPDLFFLFAVPADSEGVKNHLRLITELAGKLGNDSIMTKLQTAKFYDGLLEAFA